MAYHQRIQLVPCQVSKWHPEFSFLADNIIIIAFIIRRIHPKMIQCFLDELTNCGWIKGISANLAAALSRTESRSLTQVYGGVAELNRT